MALGMNMFCSITRTQRHHNVCIRGTSALVQHLHDHNIRVAQMNDIRMMSVKRHLREDFTAQNLTPEEVAAPVPTAASDASDVTRPACNVASMPRVMPCG